MTARETIPAPLVSRVLPGDWIETSRPPRQVSAVSGSVIRFTDGTSITKVRAT